MDVRTLKTIYKGIFDAIDQRDRRVGFGISGLVASADAGGLLEVSVVTGNYVKNSEASRTTYAGGKVSLAVADPANPRVDIVYFSSLGVLTAGTGTPTSVSTGPVPSSWPIGAAPIALAFVPAAATNFNTGGYVAPMVQYGGFGGTPRNTFASVGAAGIDATFLRTDDQIPVFDSIVPTTVSANDAACLGTTSFAARSTHRHGIPALVTTFDRITALVSVATSVETNLYSATIPSGTLGTNKTLHLHIFGDMFNNTAGAQTFLLKGKYGTQTFAQTPALQLAANASRAFWEADVWIEAFNSASLQRTDARFAGVSIGGVGTWDVAGLQLVGAGATSQDSATALTFALTTTLSSTNASLDMRVNGGVVQIFS